MPKRRPGQTERRDPHKRRRARLTRGDGSVGVAESPVVDETTTVAEPTRESVARPAPAQRPVPVRPAAARPVPQRPATGGSRFLRGSGPGLTTNWPLIVRDLRRTVIFTVVVLAILVALTFLIR